jgi:hypothetical protein
MVWLNVHLAALTFGVRDPLEPQFHLSPRRPLQVGQMLQQFRRLARAHLHHLEVSHLLARVLQFAFLRL